jgi:hypothetical protein
LRSIELDEANATRLPIVASITAARGPWIPHQVERKHISRHNWGDARIGRSLFEKFWTSPAALIAAEMRLMSLQEPNFTPKTVRVSRIFIARREKI